MRCSQRRSFAFVKGKERGGTVPFLGKSALEISNETQGGQGDHNKIQTEWYYTATDFEMSISTGASHLEKRGTHDSLSDG